MDTVICHIFSCLLCSECCSKGCYICSNTLVSSPSTVLLEDGGKRRSYKHSRNISKTISTLGLAFLAGILVLHMDEPSAFGALCYLTHAETLYLRAHYQPHMAGLHRRLYALGRLLCDLEPAVLDHLCEFDVPTALFAAPWFLSMFASSGFPIGFVARVIDLLLVDGIQALFKLALILLSMSHVFHPFEYSAHSI